MTIYCPECHESFGKASEFAEEKKEFDFSCPECGVALTYKNGSIETAYEK